MDACKFFLKSEFRCSAGRMWGIHLIWQAWVFDNARSGSYRGNEAAFAVSQNQSRYCPVHRATPAPD